LIPETANLRENIKESGIDDESKNALIERFDDINELSEIFTEISNDVMGSYVQSRQRSFVLLL
jgi:hypothetical protein